MRDLKKNTESSPVLIQVNREFIRLFYDNIRNSLIPNTEEIQWIDAITEYITCRYKKHNLDKLVAQDRKPDNQ
jgi:hypothetical protein